MIETAGDDGSVAEHGGLLPQGKAAPARAAVAGGELRPLEPLAVLDEHARRKTPAPRVFVPLVRKGSVQCGEDVVISRMETLGLRSVEIPQTVVDENAARHGCASEGRAAAKIAFKAASIVCLERVQADMYLVQARRGQKRLLPCGKQRSVRREDDAEAQLARNFQKLRKLRMRQRLSHDVQIEIIRVRAELSGEKRKFLRERKEIYDLFSACDHPFYSLSFELDVTNLYRHTHESGLSFYYSLCWLITRAMEQVEAFRMRIRGEEIVVVDELVPSCTDLMPGSDTFVIVTLPHGGDMADFCRQAREKAAGQMYLFDREMEKLDTLVYFSCLPWFPVTGFVTERNLEIDDSIPRVTWGKYRKEGETVTLNITLDLNHRLIDGVHIGKLYQMLQKMIELL